jgi:hypothetical protein
MKKLIAIGVFAAALAAAARPQPPAPLAEVDRIAADLGAISGLKPLHKIECSAITKEGVKRFLEQQVKENVKPEEIRVEETTLKKLGFVPQDFDLKSSTIELLTEQAAAFYDYRKKKLFIIDSGADIVQHSALVHEVAHALADQHFHLDKFIRRGAADDDSSLARLAVMEGQATWLMSEYLTRKTGQSLKDSPVLVKMMSRMAESAGDQYPVFDRAPLYIRETLIFPYTQGMLFQHAVFEKLGEAAFTEVFRRPPADTQQILDPRKYFNGTLPEKPAVPELASRREYKRYASGDMGQLDHAILIRQYAGEEESAALAPAWRGGAYRLFEAKKTGRLVLAYASAWESQESAARFFDVYRKVLKRKWKRFEVSSDAPDAIAGRGDDGWFVLRRDGTRVTSLEGLRALEEAGATMQARTGGVDCWRADQSLAAAAR